MEFKKRNKIINMDIEKIKIELGLRIKSFRIKNKLTQDAFGGIINLNTSNISNIENGKTYPEFGTLCSLIEHAGIEPNYLFDFLMDKNKKYNSLDIEIMSRIIDLKENQKQTLNDFLASLQ